MKLTTAFLSCALAASTFGFLYSVYVSKKKNDQIEQMVDHYAKEIAFRHAQKTNVPQCLRTQITPDTPPEKTIHSLKECIAKSRFVSK